METVFVLIIFSLSTLRTIVPMAKKENVTPLNIIFAGTHILALYYLFTMLVTLKS